MSGLRRGLLLTALSFLVGLSALPAPALDVGSDAGPEPPPNILIIVTDDQRATETLQVMPDTLRLFRDGGTSFASAYATTPWCCPARATLFTGQYAHNHGVMTNAEAADLRHEETIQAYLGAAGYQTAIAGKFLNRWLISDDPASDPPYFDRWSIQRGCYYRCAYNDDGTFRIVREYSTDFIARRAVQFLRDFDLSDEAPWFLYVAPYAPHSPFTAEPVYREAPVGRWGGNPAVRERNRSDKPPYIRNSTADLSDGRRLRELQLRTLMSVDDLVGRLFATLSELRERRRTLAIFVSDNGFLWAEHGWGGKNVPYTESIRIPLLMRWPGHVPAGAVDRRIVSNVDVVPTVLNAAGVSPPPGSPPLDGHSLLDSSWARRRILTETGGSVTNPPPWASIRSGRYQYVEYYAEDMTTVVFREYYDLRADPWQLVNLLRDGDPTNNPDVASLATLLAADRSCAGDACP
jgi:arylsulfatase A-like enzyme